MTHRLFHIGFMFPGVPKVRDLEPIFGLLGDWIRYAQTGWLLWSDVDPQVVFSTLNRAIDTADMMVIAPMITDSGFSAKLAPWMWEWLRPKLPGLVVAGEPNYLPPPPKLS